MSARRFIYRIIAREKSRCAVRTSVIKDLSVPNIFHFTGRLSACVMDGVCIGHPRCQVYHCTERLRSPRDRHCQTHRALDSVCAIGGCDRPCSDDKRTCNAPNHRSLEEERRRCGRALFELKRRLEARHVGSSIRALSAEDPPSSLIDDPDLDDPALTSNVAGRTSKKRKRKLSSTMIDDRDHDDPAHRSNFARRTSNKRKRKLPSAMINDSDIDTPAVTSNVSRKTSKKRKRKLRNTLTRRWTHNEQLLVRPCGVIVSRATFYEAESLPNSRVSIRAPTALS